VRAMCGARPRKTCEFHSIHSDVSFTRSMQVKRGQETQNINRQTAQHGHGYQSKQHETDVLGNSVL
jgi:hypothetical protein